MITLYGDRKWIQARARTNSLSVPKLCLVEHVRVCWNQLSHGAWVVSGWTHAMESTSSGQLCIWLKTCARPTQSWCQSWAWLNTCVGTNSYTISNLDLVEHLCWNQLNHTTGAVPGWTEMLELTQSRYRICVCLNTCAPANSRHRSCVWLLLMICI